MVKTKKNSDKVENSLDGNKDEVEVSKSKKGKKWSFIKFILFVFVLAFLGAIFYKEYLPVKWQKYVPNLNLSQNNYQDIQKFENEFALLSNKISVLENKLNQQNYSLKFDELEKKLEANTELSKNIADNNQRLLSLNDEVKKNLSETNLLKSEVEQVKASAAPASVVLSMVNRIDSNEEKIKSLSKQSEDGALILMGAILIKDAIERGDTYFVEAQILKEIAKNSKDVASEIEVIVEYSNKRLIKRSELIDEFNKVASDAVSISEMKDEIDWKNKVYNKFKSLVKVRRTDIISEEDMSMEAVLARAEKYIGNSQLENAVLEVEKSNQDNHIIKKSGLESWLLKAKDRVKIDKAISSILAKSLAIIKVGHINK